jgi:uncharacterized protein
MPWEWPVGAGCAFLLALVTAPVGVSGAVLLLPIQLSLLHVASPAVTPTNLLFNVAAVPGGLMRFRRERRLSNPLTGLLVAGTLPGVIVGAIIRVDWLSGGRAFEFVAAGVLLPLGLWLVLGSQHLERPRPTPSASTRCWIWLLSLVVGTVGGIYGIGGGSLLAPVLLLAGFSAYEVAPATLAATFLTSIGGIVTYQILQFSHGGAISPDWALGAFLGAGGFAGSYLGARLQRHLPERSLRKLLGAIACLVALRYIQQGITAHHPSPSAAHRVVRPPLANARLADDQPRSPGQDGRASTVGVQPSLGGGTMLVRSPTLSPAQMPRHQSRHRPPRSVTISRAHRRRPQRTRCERSGMSTVRRCSAARASLSARLTH